MIDQRHRPAITHFYSRLINPEWWFSLVSFLQCWTDIRGACDALWVAETSHGYHFYQSWKLVCRLDSKSCNNSGGRSWLSPFYQRELRLKVHSLPQPFTMRPWKREAVLSIWQQPGRKNSALGGRRFGPVVEVYPCLKKLCRIWSYLEGRWEAADKLLLSHCERTE